MSSLSNDILRLTLLNTHRYRKKEKKAWSLDQSFRECPLESKQNGQNKEQGQEQRLMEEGIGQIAAWKLYGRLMGVMPLPIDLKSFKKKTFRRTFSFFLINRFLISFLKLS